MMNEFENIRIEQLPGNNNESSLDNGQLKEHFDDKFFDDLQKGKVKIKKQGDTYIFEQEDINSSLISNDNKYIKKFRVKEKAFQEFLKEEKKKDSIMLESDALLKEFFNQIHTKKQLNIVKDIVVDSELDNLGNAVDKSIESSNERLNLRDNPEVLLVEVDNLLDRFEKNQTWPKAPRIKENRYSKVRFIQVVRDDILLLKSIKRELNRYDYTTNVDYFANTVDTLKSHKEQLEKVRQMITTGKNTAEIPSILRSIDDVKKESLFQNIAAKYNIEFNNLMKDLTLKKLRNKDSEGFQEYLEAVWSGEIEHPEQDKFYIKHKKDFEYVASIDPALYMEITSKKDIKQSNVIYSGNIGATGSQRMNARGRTSSGFDKAGEGFSDLLVKLNIIDENDTAKKEAWSKFGKVGILALGAFAIYKIFSSKGKERWGWIGGTLGGLLLVNNFSGVQKWFKDAFGKSNASVQDIAKQTNTSPEIVNEYIQPQASVLRCLGGIPISELISKGIVEEKGGKTRINYDNYNAYLDMTNMSPSEKEANRQSLLEIKNDASGEMVDKSLKYMGINGVKGLNDLSSSDPKKTLLDTPNVSGYFERLSSPINAHLREEGFKPANPKAWYEMTSENIYEKPSNKKILEWIKKGYLVLDKQKGYSLNDMISNIEIYDLENKTINGLVDGSGRLIKFNSYEELFDATQLTNFIKNNFKGKTAVSPKPFHPTLLGSIEFDNTQWYEIWKNETDVIKSNFYKNTLNSVSPTLNQYKDSYVKYLNDWREREGKNS